VSQQSRSVTVPTDYDTIQEAIDEEIHAFQQHHVEINVNRGAYSEDVTIPAFHAYGKGSDNFTPLVDIRGDESTPSNVQVKSLLDNSVGKRPTRVRGFEFMDVHPEADLATLQKQASGVMMLHNCNFTNANGNANRAISVYGGGLITKKTIDLGTGNYTNGIVVKNLGRYVSEAVGSGGDITGSVTRGAYWNQNGMLAFDTNESLSGTIRSDRFPIYEFNSNNYSEGVIVHGLGQFGRSFAITDFDNLDMQGNVILNTPRVRFNLSKAGAVSSGQASIAVDDGSGPFSEGDLYITVEDSSGTEKDIPITDFSTGTTA
jgi:hypothetical protein